MTSTPTLPPPRDPLDRDPLAALAVSTVPIVLEGRYHLPVGALVRLRRSRRGRWAVAVGYSTLAIGLAWLAARHFATTSWPLSDGEPGVLAAAGLLLLGAQALKAFAWARLFSLEERPTPLALAAGNGGAALIGGAAAAKRVVAVRAHQARRATDTPTLDIGAGFSIPALTAWRPRLRATLIGGAGSVALQKCVGHPRCDPLPLGVLRQATLRGYETGTSD